MQFVIDGLQKRFDKKEVLRGASFAFDFDKIYGLLGRNGAGKTTLFNCISGDIRLDGGDFFFLGEDGSRRELKPQDVGYVLSTPTVPEFLTAREFLKFFLEINEGRITDPRTPDEYFARMRIAAEDRDRLMKDFSHGMKNKMQMLVNLIAEPTLFLLDEPLTSLDVVVSEEMKALLRQEKAGRVTILSTHLLDLALDLCDEIVLLKDGVLEPVDKSNLDEADFKEKILSALSEGESADA